MRGTRYGDFSRFPVGSADGYTAVLMQQGRVQLDADFNEQRMLAADALRVAIGDLFGGSAAPSCAPGYRLQAEVAVQFEGEDRLVVDDADVLVAADGDERTIAVELSWSGGACVVLDMIDSDDAFRCQLEIDADGRLTVFLDDRDWSDTTVLRADRSLPIGSPVELVMVLGVDYVEVHQDDRRLIHGSHPRHRSPRARRLVLGGPADDASAHRGLRGTIRHARVWRGVHTPARRRAAAVRRPAAERDRRAPDQAGRRAADREGTDPRSHDRRGRGTPDRRAADRRAPERGEPERGEAERGAPERGEAERGAPERGEPERGEAERGEPERGEAERGEAERGAPDRREPDRRAPERGDRRSAQRRTADRRAADRRGPDRGAPDRRELHGRAPERRAPNGRTRRAPEYDPALLAEWSFEEVVEGEVADWVDERPARIEGGAATRRRLVDLTIEPGRYYVDGVLCSLGGEQHYTSQPGSPVAPLPTSGQHLAYLEVWEETVSAVEDPALREVALGGLDTTVRTRTMSSVRIVQTDSEPEVGDSPALQRAIAAAGAVTTGRLAAQHVGDYAPGNYLYRVEIHESGSLLSDGSTEPNASVTPPLPTFKWSRQNGGGLFAVSGGDPGTETVGVLPAPNGVAPLAGGDIVEPLPAEGSLDGPAHPLLRVRDVSDRTDQITLDAPLPAGVAYLRRWDQAPVESPPPEGVGAQQTAGLEWIDLEDGIRIRFESGYFRRGDYWWIVSRQDDRSIEWPVAHGHPVALAPAGVERLVAPLAFLSLQDGQAQVVDLRRIVSAVVQQPARPAPEPDDGAGENEPPEDLPADAGDESGSLPELEEEVAEEIEQDELVEASEEALEREDAEEQESEVFVGVELPEERIEPEPERRTHRGPWRHVRSHKHPADEPQAAAALGDEIMILTSTQLLRLNPGSSEPEVIARAPGERREAALCIVDERLLVVGGMPGSEDADGRVWELELSTQRWSERARMPVPRSHPAVTTARGRVHVIGGETHTVLRRLRGSHHVYDPREDRWTEERAMPTHRAGATVAAVQDRLHVIGGETGKRMQHAPAPHEIYDLAGGGWEAGPALPRRGRVIASAAHRERTVVLLEDAQAADRPQSAFAYDPSARTWSELGALPERLSRPLMLNRGDRAVVLGAGDDGRLAAYELAAQSARSDLR